MAIQPPQRALVTVATPNLTYPSASSVSIVFVFLSLKLLLVMATLAHNIPGSLSIFIMKEPGALGSEITHEGQLPSSLTKKLTPEEKAKLTE